MLKILDIWSKSLTFPPEVLKRLTDRTELAIANAASTGPAASAGPSSSSTVVNGAGQVGIERRGQADQPQGQTTFDPRMNQGDSPPLIHTRLDSDLLSSSGVGATRYSGPDQPTAMGLRACLTCTEGTVGDVRPTSASSGCSSTSCISSGPVGPRGLGWTYIHAFPHPSLPLHRPTGKSQKRPAAAKLRRLPSFLPPSHPPTRHPQTHACASRLPLHRRNRQCSRSPIFRRPQTTAGRSIDVEQLRAAVELNVRPSFGRARPSAALDIDASTPKHPRQSARTPTKRNKRNTSASRPRKFFSAVSLFYHMLSQHCARG